MILLVAILGLTFSLWGLRRLWRVARAEMRVSRQIADERRRWDR